MIPELLIIGNFAYLVSTDECGEYTENLGEIELMTEQEKKYFGIK